jgi:hypothetical protein
MCFSKKRLQKKVNDYYVNEYLKEEKSIDGAIYTLKSLKDESVRKKYRILGVDLATKATKKYE